MLAQPTRECTTGFYRSNWYPHMNLDESEKDTESTEAPKKLSRKEKKAKKRAEKAAAKVAKQEPASIVASDAATSTSEPQEVDAELEPAPVPEIPPTTYSAWEKISPPAKRKKQLATMESGYKEVLALVHSMRENQEVLLQSFQKLPEAVDSVKKLADHSAQQSDLLTAMNEQLQSGSAGKFNETLTSMDKTTQLLLERAQRSEERLYSMLRRAQRRIAFMTLLVLLLFLGTGGAILFLAFPDQTHAWLEERGWKTSEEPPVEDVLPEQTKSTDISESETEPLESLPEPEKAIMEDVTEAVEDKAAEAEETIPEEPETPTEEDSIKSPSRVRR